MKKRLPLTKKEEKVWGYILGYITDNEYPPTIMEIAEIAGSPNHQTGLYFVQQLEDKGYIARTRGKWRNISIVEKT